MSSIGITRVIANIGLIVVFIWLVFVIAALLCWLLSPDLSGCKKTGNTQTQTVVQHITTGKLIVPVVTTLTSEEYICKDGKKLWN